jgi:putative membrane protein
MSHAAHSMSMIEVPATLLVALAALIYARGWFRIRRSQPTTISVGRLGAFMAGLLVVWIAIGSPLTAFQHEFLTVHMVQHVLLMAVAPPLLLLGFHRVLHSPDTQSLRRFLTHPVVCWLAPVAALIGWHVPAVFELAMHSRSWHAVQAASFLVTGLLFWSPVLQSRSRLATMQPWWIPLYLFAATLPCDALSAFLVFCDRVVYPSYLSSPRLLNVSALNDQACAGALMWVSVTLIYLVPAVLITLQLLSPPQTYPRAAELQV